MAKVHWIALLALLLVAADAPRPYDWSTADLSHLGDTKDFAATRKLCAAVIHAAPPAADRPSRAQAAALKACDSEALYYGIGVPADPAKARRCAFVEAARAPSGGPSQPFEGRGMLATIYANGRGAKQDYDLALHYACGLDHAAMESKGRVERLAALRARHDPTPKFDNCLDLTSGSLGGWCAAHQERLSEQARARRIAHLAAGWTVSQRRAFSRLRKSAQQYAETLHEMDCFRGTAQAQCTIDGANGVMTDFTARIVALASGRADALEDQAMARRRARDAAAASARPAAADGLPDDERQAYAANARAILSDRALFERDLVDFARVTFPAVTPHRIRRIFSDL